MPPNYPSHPRPHIPKSVWGLGFNSFFMEISNNLIHGLLVIYLESVLRFSVSSIGVIEGMAEATNSVMKAFSGRLAIAWDVVNPLP